MVGVQCEDKCPDGQAKIGAGRKCDVYLAGKKLNPAGDGCDDEKCPYGQAKIGPDGRCDVCPEGKKPNPAGDGCVGDDPKEERERSKQAFEDKKTEWKSGGSKGLKGAGPDGTRRWHPREFSVTFTVAKEGKWGEGLCGPIIKLQSMHDWGGDKWEKDTVIY
ncbi:MAG: hypothetical protein Q9173_006438, partial [Seirophora scorigena]